MLAHQDAFVRVYFCPTSTSIPSMTAASPLRAPIHLVTVSISLQTSRKILGRFQWNSHIYSKSRTRISTSCRRLPHWTSGPRSRSEPVSGSSHPEAPGPRVSRQQTIAETWPVALCLGVAFQWRGEDAAQEPIFWRSEEALVAKLLFEICSTRTRPTPLLKNLGAAERKEKPPCRL